MYVFRRREVRCIIFFIFSLIFLIYNFTGVGESLQGDILDFRTLYGYFASIYGTIVFLMLHIRPIIRRTPRWQWHIITLVAYWFMFFLGLSSYLVTKAPGSMFLNITSEVTRVIEVGIVSYVGLYMLIVFYRAGRNLRSLDVGIMLFSCVFGLMLNAPIGSTLWSGFPVVATWLKDVPGVGGNQALILGFGIGIFGLYLRAVLGHERTYMGEL